MQKGGENPHFSPDGKRALSGGRDVTVRLWDVATGKVLHNLERHAEPIRAVAFSPDGKYALSGSMDRTLRLWDVATGNLVREFTGSLTGASSVAFTPDGRHILSCHGSRTANRGGWEPAGFDNRLRLWDVATGKKVAEKEVGQHPMCVAITRDGRSAVVGCPDRLVRLYELKGRDAKPEHGPKD